MQVNLIRKSMQDSYYLATHTKSSMIGNSSPIESYTMLEMRRMHSTHFLGPVWTYIAYVMNGIRPLYVDLFARSELAIGAILFLHLY